MTAGEIGAFTASDLARLERTAVRPVDTSDIPEITDAEWADFQPADDTRKVSVTLRIRSDVLACFKGDNPKGYQRRIHAVLEHYAAKRRGKPA